MTVVPVDPSSAVAVSRDEASVLAVLEQADLALSSGLEMTGAANVASLKAKVAMAETYSKELSLSKNIRTKAQEMVRRAEWSLEQAIAADREAGLIKELQSGGGVHCPGVRGVSSRSESDQPDTRPSARDFFSGGDERSQVFQIGQASKEEFAEALGSAKAEGNLSRANLVRKVKQARDVVVTRDMRAEMIRNLAEQGYTSRQMPDKVGVTEETVRLIAREFDIEIPADKVTGRTRRLNHTAMVEQTVVALSNEVDALKYIDFAEVDFSEADEWVASLNQSISALRKFANRIKETTHV